MKDHIVGRLTSDDDDDDGRLKMGSDMMTMVTMIIMMLMIIGRVKRGRGWGEADTPIISLSLGGQLPFLQCAFVYFTKVQ